MGGFTIELFLIILFIPLCYFVFDRDTESAFIGKIFFLLKSSALMAIFLTAVTVYKEGWRVGLAMGPIWFIVSGVIMSGSSVFWP